MRANELPVWLGAVVLVLALAAGLGLKISAKGHVQATPEDVRPAIIHFLQSHEFRVAPLQAETRKVAAAGRLGCQIQVVQAQARGYDQTSIRQMAGPADDFFVVYQDALYDVQPLWMTKAYYYWDRLLGELGIAALPRPVLAVIASPPCSARGLPWHELF